MQGRRGRSRAAGPSVARRALSGGADAQSNAVFGRRLAQARKRAGLTQVDLAAALDRDRSLISHLERGQTGKMADVLRNVARELGVSADYLLGLTDTPVCSVCEMRELQGEMQALLDRSDGKIDRLTEAINLLNVRLNP